MTEARQTPSHHRHSSQLARIVFHLLSTKEAYNETVFHRCDDQGGLAPHFLIDNAS